MPRFRSENYARQTLFSYFISRGNAWTFLFGSFCARSCWILSDRCHDGWAGRAIFIIRGTWIFAEYDIQRLTARRFAWTAHNRPGKKMGLSLSEAFSLADGTRCKSVISLNCLTPTGRWSLVLCACAPSYFGIPFSIHPCKMLINFSNGPIVRNETGETEAHLLPTHKEFGPRNGAQIMAWY